MLLAEAAPLSGSGGTPGGSTYFRRSSSTGAVLDGSHAADADVEAAADADDAAPPPSDNMASALGALLLPVYIPRAVLSAGSGLCVVVRRVACAGADAPRARFASDATLTAPLPLAPAGRSLRAAWAATTRRRAWWPRRCR